MPEASTITLLVRRFESGDEAAFQTIWNRYSAPLVKYVRSRLRPEVGSIIAADEAEDLVQETFLSFYRRAAGDRAVKVESREALWALLGTIARRKIAKLRLSRNSSHHKPIGGVVLLETDLQNLPGETRLDDIGLAPTAEDELILDDQIQHIRSLLNDEALDEILVSKLMGLTHRDIAAKVGRTVEYVESRVRLIRDRVGVHLASREIADEIRARFEAELQAGGRPTTRPLLKKAPSSERLSLLRQLAVIELKYLGRVRKASDLGRVRFGPYELLEVIKAGGIGIVIKARQKSLDRFVAIKMPLSADANDPRNQFFLRGHRAASHLFHDNICCIYDSSLDIHGKFTYFIMRYIKGRPLSEWTEATRPSARQGVEIVARLARAIGYAHGKGVLHNDLSPRNIMIEERSDNPVIIDFDFASELGRPYFEGTEDYPVVGTLGYLSPERAGGRTDSFSPKSDIYSLGAILYMLICGRPAFHFDSSDGRSALGRLNRIQTEEPPVPRLVLPEIDPDLEAICLRAMARDPLDRYASADAFADDLERFTKGTLKGRLESMGRPAVEQTAAESGPGAVSRDGRLEIDRVEVGEVAYLFKRPVVGRFSRADDGLEIFKVDDLDIVGCGPSTEAAHENWKGRLHVGFQELSRKRPFEMSTDESELWAKLARLIDLDAYADSRPYVFRETGRLSKVWPTSAEVTWWGSDQSESAAFSRMPAEFAAYKPGQWFEAIVERDRRSRKLLRVRYIEPIEPVRPLTEGEAADFWRSFTPTTELPKSSREWTRS
jgi:serine/threonine protein kinase/DNA-directed RNA polymerase specialized sigma24 family protein